LDESAHRISFLLAIHATEAFRQHATGLDRNIDVNRLFNSPHLTFSRGGRGKQSDRKSHRLSHHYRSRRLAR